MYADLLVRWQTTINLVAPSTLPEMWSRHIHDSLQVQAAAPEARTWIDLGSGGGFPGLVTAILLLIPSGIAGSLALRATTPLTGLLVLASIVVIVLEHIWIVADVLRRRTKLEHEPQTGESTASA